MQTSPQGSEYHPIRRSTNATFRGRIPTHKERRASALTPARRATLRTDPHRQENPMIRAGSQPNSPLSGDARIPPPDAVTTSGLTNASSTNVQVGSQELAFDRWHWRPEEWRGLPPCVYAITGGRPGWVKVGVTNKLEQRLEHFAMGNPWPLVVEGVMIPSEFKAKSLEKMIHPWLEFYRQRNEWFDFSDEPRWHKVIEQATEHAYGRAEEKAREAALHAERSAEWHARNPDYSFRQDVLMGLGGNIGWRNSAGHFIGEPCDQLTMRGVFDPYAGKFIDDPETGGCTLAEWPPPNLDPDVARVIIEAGVLDRWKAARS